MLTSCCHYNFFASDQTKLYAEIKALQGTRYGRMALEHFKKQGAIDGYKKGLIAGQTQCAATMNPTVHQEMQLKYHPNSFAGYEPKMKRD